MSTMNDRDLDDAAKRGFTGLLIGFVTGSAAWTAAYRLFVWLSA